MDISHDGIRLLDTYSLSVPITSLNFSTNWSHLCIGSSKGALYTYDTNAPGTHEQLMDDHNGNFVGVQSLAPGLDHAVVRIY